jgi:FixJ family two-component response regulator
MSCRIPVAENPSTVFVVDDDESVLASLRLLLESSGYRVGTFKSAEDFLHSTRKEKPCCLLLDIRLPGMSGFKLQEHLLESRVPVPVIFMTGRDRERIKDEAMRLGAIAYLRKPFDEQCLFDAIRSACGRGG